MRKLVASILIVALCQTQVFATAVVPGDPPPPVSDANGQISEDAFRALSLQQQMEYIEARQAVLFRHDTRINVLNDNNFDDNANAVESNRSWAKAFKVFGFVFMIAVGLANAINPTLGLLNVGGTFQAYVQYACTLAVALGLYFVGYRDNFLADAQKALDTAVEINDQDAANLLALEAILAAEQRALAKIENAHVDILYRGPLDRNEALHYFGYRVREILEAADLPTNGIDGLVQFARMQNTGTREQALAYLHLLLREALFHPERMARIVVPREGLVEVLNAEPATRNANLMALATVHDQVEVAQPAATPAPRQPARVAPPPQEQPRARKPKTKVKRYYEWVDPPAPPAPPPLQNGGDKEKDDVEMKPAGNQTGGAALPPANDNGDGIRFAGAGGISEL